MIVTPGDGGGALRREHLPYGMGAMDHARGRRSVTRGIPRLIDKGDNHLARCA